MNVSELQKICNHAAKQCGVTKFDFYSSYVEESTVKVQGGKPDAMTEAQKTSAIVRVWNARGAVGVTSTSDVSELGILNALKIAKDVAEICDPTDAPDFSPAARENLQTKITENLIPLIKTQDALAQLLGAEEQLLKACPEIKSVPYNALAQKGLMRVYLNSEGSQRFEATNVSYAYLYSLAQKPDGKPRSAGESVVSTTAPELDLKKCVQVVADKTKDFLNYKTVSSGQYKVVFKPEAFLSLLGAFSNMFNAQRVLDKQSLSKPETLGTVVAHDLITIYDDPLHKGNIGASAFDSEGTPTRRVTLVEKGKLVSFLHSAGTAKRMQTKPTGNANIGAKVSISPHFFHVDGAPTVGRDFSQDDKYIIIDNLHALHAGVNALQGSFSLPFDGWIVENGKRTSLDSVTVAGDFLTLLKTIAYVGSHAEVTPSGVCPEIGVDVLSITGA